MGDRSDEGVADIDFLPIFIGAEESDVKVAERMKEVKRGYTFKIGVDVKPAVGVENLVAEDIGFFPYANGFFKAGPIGEGEGGDIGIGPKAVFPIGMFFDPCLLQGEVFFG